MVIAPSNVSINQLYYYWYYQLWINCLILFLSKQLFLFIWLLFQIYCWIRFPPFIYLVHTFYIFGDPCVTGNGSCTVLCKLFQLKWNWNNLCRKLGTAIAHVCANYLHYTKIGIIIAQTCAIGNSFLYNVKKPMVCHRC